MQLVEDWLTSFPQSAAEIHGFEERSVSSVMILRHKKQKNHFFQTAERSMDWREGFYMLEQTAGGFPLNVFPSVLDFYVV